MSEADARVAAVVRPEIRALSAYAVAKAEGMIKLDAMENPYGLPVALRERIASAVRDAPINRYPDGSADGVKSALRDAYRIDADLGIVVGNGSDELIQIITCALASPGSAMAAPDPSFVMYRTNALYMGMRFVGVDLTADFRLDLPRWREVLAGENPSLVYIAYPNNPTGNLFDDRAIEEIIRLAPGLVVVDEAYHAFAGKSFVDRLREFPNLLVLRTLSKIGMAGLRLGYAIAPRAWTDALDKVRPPYNLNVLTQAVAPLVLAEREMLADQARTIRDERARVGRELAALPAVRVFPSDANFIVIRVADGPGWFNALKSAGILVKNLHGWHARVANCLRLTIGTPQENDRLLAALRNLA